MLNPLRPSTLQGKFLSGLALASIILGLLFAIGFYLHMRSAIEDEIHDKAELIFNQVDSVQSYVRKVLRPAMFEAVPGQFIIEAMSSSYISRAVMDNVNTNGSTLYRRVAIDARNPEFEANKLEQELIAYFRSEPEKRFWKGYKHIKNEDYYVMARPVAFTQKCMRCHGDPSRAPKELIATYGDRGFNHTLGSIDGVDLVGLSVAESVGRLQETIVGYFIFFVLGAFIFFSTTNLLFKLLVVDNIKRLTKLFREDLEETGGENLIQQMEQQDEIEELEAGMIELSKHLSSARAQLKNYAENLKSMVADRTEELTHEARERRADVELFVRLLSDMRSSRTRSDMWKLTLPQIGKRFNASSVSFVCTFASQNFHAWPDPEVKPEIPDNWIELLTESASLFEEHRAIIPVESSVGNAEGLLFIEWKNSSPPVAQDLLQALGRQLGTVAENLTALDSLMRQMDTLQSIVEGITDPLALMDSGCIMVTANQAARGLASELTAGRVKDGNILQPLLNIEPEAECPIARVADGGKPHTREVNLPCGRSFALSLYPVSGPNQNRVVAYVRETTREKRMLAQMQQSEKMVTVGKLAAGLAHEINNPLGVILCYAELLRQNVHEDQQMQDLDIILRHTRQAQRVLSDLLNFARTKGKTSGTCDAGIVVERISEIFSVQAVKKSVKIYTRASTGLPLAAMGEHELEQVLSNLMLNALDAVREENGEIYITAGTDGDDVTITIADNGTGIDDAALPHLFDPFFTTKDLGTGTGLGLAVVYGMVTEAGGSVLAGTSALLGGAEFIVRLPKTESEYQDAL